jgi:hypothetical protein
MPELEPQGGAAEDDDGSSEAAEAETEADEDAAKSDAFPAAEPVTRWAKLFGSTIYGVEGDPLEDVDGVAVRLYHLLWSTAGGSTPPAPTNFRLPDTVVYKYRLPVAWFFTGRGGEARFLALRVAPAPFSVLTPSTAAAQAPAQRCCCQDHRRIPAPQGTTGKASGRCSHGRRRAHRPLLVKER